ncbi:hypothetical protein LZ32DRAFT_153081 [Colletotrichum eremochloae]|nr:hypothetical protein LZ32DRAFT_153081 [Colletotrichum eremochloae]
MITASRAEPCKTGSANVSKTPEPRRHAVPVRVVQLTRPPGHGFPRLSPTERDLQGRAILQLIESAGRRELNPPPPRSHSGPRTRTPSRNMCKEG